MLHFQSCILPTHVGSLPCGQIVGFGAIHPLIAYAKLRSLSQGATNASNRLRRRAAAQ